MSDWFVGLVDVLAAAEIAQHRKGVDAMHRYSVGQFVELTPSPMRLAAPGEYEIRQTMPAPDVSSASPRYRIKSVAEIYERIVSETELTLPKADSQALPAESTDMQLPGLEPDRLARAEGPNRCR